MRKKTNKLSKKHNRTVPRRRRLRINVKGISRSRNITLNGINMAVGQTSNITTDISRNK